MAVILEPQGGRFEFQVGPKGKKFSLPKFSALPIDLVDKMLKASEESPDTADTKALTIYADYIKEQCPGIEKYNLNIELVSLIVQAWQEDAGVNTGELLASATS